LRQHNHDVVSVYEQAQGSLDDTIIRSAADDDRILITNDKDFGEKVYRDKRSHRGVILLRLEDERPASKIAVLSRFLERYGARVHGSFVVVSEHRVRFARR
jgi:predicted nuclease of predicted toxin-antitoxin system